MSDDLDTLARRLEASGNYRVLRRLNPDGLSQPVPEGVETRRGMILDCETTGLDPAIHEIVELALLPFRYAPDTGIIYEIGPGLDLLNQPTQPIPAAMSALHGVTDEMVAGKRIDPAIVEAAIADTAPIIAHHAAFDRSFVERLVPAFATVPWACSWSQIDWTGEGIDGHRLGELATAAGFFYDRHYAMPDCYAVLKLLSLPLPVSGRSALLHLLEKGRQPAWRVWAIDSPFGQKDVLKQRGYHWDAERKSWWTDIVDIEAEIAWLQRQIYQRSIVLPARKITAFNRFSERVHP